MKRWPAFLLILALFTCIGTGQAGGAEGAMIEAPCGREGVEEFMTAFARICSKGTLDGYPADEEHCFNVTPESVAQETDIRIFKFSNSCRSFVLVEEGLSTLYGEGWQIRDGQMTKICSQGDSLLLF